MKKFILFIPVVLIFSILGYMLLSPSLTSLSTATNTPTLPPSGTTQHIQPTVDASDLLAGGSSYSDTQGVYTVLYPSEYQLDTTDPIHPRVYKIGPTQKGQTEMYDGVIVVFETIELNGTSLSSWVDNHINIAVQDGVSQLTSPKKEIIFKTYPGFMYEIEGLGTARYLVLQKNTASTHAVVISTSVYDPQNLGFQTEVDKILSTIDLLK